MAIPILMYHQVDQPGPRGSPLRGLVVSPAMFAQQMATLRVLGFRGLSLTQLEPYLDGRERGRVVGITFDDGYLNNLEHALPVLARNGFTATCYVVANAIGMSNVWDAPLGVTQVPLMNHAQIESWIDAGQEIGSHGLDHVDLSTLDSAEQRLQIDRSRQELESRFPRAGAVQHFCYPFGRFTAETVALVAQAGYRTATTTDRGRIQLSGDALTARARLQLPRVRISRTSSFFHIALKCLTPYGDR